MNEQVIAELQALKAEPGFQMRWQEIVQHAIDALSAPVIPAPPPPPALEPVAAKEPEPPKTKVTTAKPAVTAPAKTKGKK